MLKVTIEYEIRGEPRRRVLEIPLTKRGLAIGALKAFRRAYHEIAHERRVARHG